MVGKEKGVREREVVILSTALPKVVDPHTYLEVPVDVVEPRDGAAESAQSAPPHLPTSSA